MRNRATGLFEVIWFVLGGLMLFMGIDVSTEAGIAGSWYYFVFSLLSFVMYARRRSMRLKSK